jgi:hypothetical protein
MMFGELMKTLWTQRSLRENASQEQFFGFLINSHLYSSSPYSNMPRESKITL